MKKLNLFLLLLITFLSIVSLSCGGGGKANILPGKEPIMFAKVDPAFSSTQIESIAILPLSNGVEFEEAAWVIYENLIGSFRAKYPDFKMTPPDEMMMLISSNNLSDDFNIFLGDYNNTGVANPDFLIKVREVLEIDAVLFGKIIAYGTYMEEKKSFLSLAGLGKIFKSTNRLGIRLTTFRGIDGRWIWEGQHIVSGSSKKMGLSDLAGALCEVIVNYFGRRSY